jgi:hypothetical protein
MSTVVSRNSGGRHIENISEQNAEEGITVHKTGKVTGDCKNCVKNNYMFCTACQLLLRRKVWYCWRRQKCSKSFGGKI